MFAACITLERPYISDSGPRKSGPTAVRAKKETHLTIASVSWLIVHTRSLRATLSLNTDTNHATHYLVT